MFRNLYKSTVPYDSANNKQKSSEILDIPFVLKFNKVKQNEANVADIFKEDIEFKSRKKLIETVFLTFLDKELNFVEETLILIQNLYDFIVKYSD